MFHKFTIAVIALLVIAVPLTIIRAQTAGHNPTYTSPLPILTIAAPTADQKLSGDALVQINVDKVSPITSMEVYANDIYLGTATNRNSSLNYYFLWQISKYADGNYLLSARAYYYDASAQQSITLYTSKINVTLINKPVVSTPMQTPVSDTTSSPDSQNSQTASTNQDNPTDTTSGSEETANDSTPNPIITTPTDETAQQSEIKTELANTIFDQAGWTTISSVTFPQKSVEQLMKIERKQDKNKKDYLVFSGIAKALSQVNIKIYSEVIVLTTRANSQGQWEYVFDKPLESGKHKVTVEVVDTNGQAKTVSNNSFMIAVAQAAIGNPSGSSLNLVDPTQQSYIKYLSIGGGAILFALLVLLLIYKFKRHPRKIVYEQN